MQKKKEKYFFLALVDEILKFCSFIKVDKPLFMNNISPKLVIVTKNNILVLKLASVYTAELFYNISTHNYFFLLHNMLVF